MRRNLIAATLFATLVPLSAYAAPSGNETDGASDVQTCASGEVWNQEKQACAPADEQSLNDEQLFENGRALAYLGRFDEAVTVLTMIKDQQRPDVLNYLGYATRNAGDVEAGLTYYKQAIALDPNYTLARSYMGQALLLKGDTAGAIAQLDEIETRCGRDCREYVLLADALVAATEDGSWQY